MSSLLRVFFLLPFSIFGLSSVAYAVPDAETAYIFNSFSFLVHGFLVMLMAAGFCMLETGLVRAKKCSSPVRKEYWFIFYCRINVRFCRL
jgi:hypothetical protein